MRLEKSPPDRDNPLQPPIGRPNLELPHTPGMVPLLVYCTSDLTPGLVTPRILQTTGIPTY